MMLDEWYDVYLELSWNTDIIAYFIVFPFLIELIILFLQVINKMDMYLPVRVAGVLDIKWN